MVTDIQSESIMNAVSQSSSLPIKLLDDLLDMVISSIREEDSLGRTRDSDGIVFPGSEDFDLYMNNEHCSQSPLALLRLLKFLSFTQKKPVLPSQELVQCQSQS